MAKTRRLNREDYDKWFNMRVAQLLEKKEEITPEKKKKKAIGRKTLRFIRSFQPTQT